MFDNLNKPRNDFIIRKSEYFDAKIVMQIKIIFKLVKQYSILNYVFKIYFEVSE